MLHTNGSACDQHKSMKSFIQTALAVCGSVITALLGEWNIALEILLIFIVIDYITGVAVATKTKSLRSSVGFEGIMKKASIFLVVVLAAQLDRIAEISGFFRSATAFFFVANEGLSILENVGRLGVPYPPFIKNHLQQLRDTHGASAADKKTTPQDEAPGKDEKHAN